MTVSTQTSFASTWKWNKLVFHTIKHHGQRQQLGYWGRDLCSPRTSTWSPGVGSGCGRGAGRRLRAAMTWGTSTTRSAAWRDLRPAPQTPPPEGWASLRRRKRASERRMEEDRERKVLIGAAPWRNLLFNILTVLHCVTILHNKAK